MCEERETVKKTKYASAPRQTRRSVPAAVRSNGEIQRDLGRMIGGTFLATGVLRTPVTDREVRRILEWLLPLVLLQGLLLFLHHLLGGPTPSQGNVFWSAYGAT